MITVNFSGQRFSSSSSSLKVLLFLLDLPLRLPVPGDADFSGLEDGEVARHNNFGPDRQVNVDLVEASAQTTAAAYHLKGSGEGE